MKVWTKQVWSAVWSPLIWGDIGEERRKWFSTPKTEITFCLRRNLIMSMFCRLASCRAKHSQNDTFNHLNNLLFSDADCFLGCCQEPVKFQSLTAVR